MMNYKTLDYYNTKAKEFFSGTVNVQFTEIQDKFLAYLPEGGKILDFGCGSGRDTKYFLGKGFIVEAIDGSEELCKLASVYTGIQVKQMLFEELSVEEKYDGIWACASILHVERELLPQMLKKMAYATKKNGMIYASFKYGDFSGVKNRRFFTYFTEKRFETMLKEVPELIIEELWISADVRAERGEERWLNIMLRKQN